MEFDAFFRKYQDLPLISSKLIMVGQAKEKSLLVQMSRWVKSGHLIQLRRGLYVLASHYRKISPAVYYVAGELTGPSYVSLEKALEYHHLIPEAVYAITSVTTRRPGFFETALGRYDYRHIREALFWGYFPVVENGQTGYMAYPEKAILDFVYLRPVSLTGEYLDSLRLQNLEKFDIPRLREFARRFGRPGIMRAAEALERYIDDKREKEKIL